MKTHCLFLWHPLCAVGTVSPFKPCLWVYTDVYGSLLPYNFCLHGSIRRLMVFLHRNTSFNSEATVYHYRRNLTTPLGCGPMTRVQCPPHTPSFANCCAMPWLVHHILFAYSAGSGPESGNPLGHLNVLHMFTKGCWLLVGSLPLVMFLCLCPPTHSLYLTLQWLPIPGIAEAMLHSCIWSPYLSS